MPLPFVCANRVILVQQLAYLDSPFPFIMCMYFTHSSQDLDGIVKVLLHKGTESNAFIREDVEKALCEMVVNVSHHKCLIALINGGLA